MRRQEASKQRGLLMEGPDNVVNSTRASGRRKDGAHAGQNISSRLRMKIAALCGLGLLTITGCNIPSSTARSSETNGNVSVSSQEKIHSAMPPGIRHHL